MSDRTGGPTGFDAHLTDGTPVVARLAGGRLVVEDAAGRPVRDVHLDDVLEVARKGLRVEVSSLRELPVEVECERAEQLDAALVAACCAVPELTRALRSLGSSRLRAGGGAQREFFAPLLEARRRAEESVGRAGIVRAFDPDRLNRAFDAYFLALTERRADLRPAARRAFAAQAEEAAEPLRGAIAAVREMAGAAANPREDSRVASWRAWSQALHSMFAAADQCWGALQPALVNDPATGG